MNKQILLSLVVLFLVTVALYFNSVHNDFIFDDRAQTVDNPAVTSFAVVSTLKGYRPIRTLSYMVDIALFGKSPASFRGMNIFYHLCMVFAVFWFFLLIKFDRTTAFIAAFIFAIHPVQTDSVAYISGRRDILTSLFYLLSMNFFILFYRRKRKKKGGYSFLVFATVAMLLSFFSKQVGATIPLAWLLIIYLFDGKKLFEKAWFMGLSMVMVALFSILALYTVQTGGSDLVTMHSVKFHGDSPLTHYTTAITIFIYYISLTIFPLQLFLDNAAYPLITTLVHPRALFALSGIIFYIAIIFLLFKRDQGSLSRRPVGRSFSEDGSCFTKADKILFLLLFFLLALAPVLQIIPLHEIVADHYLYLPIVAFSGIVALPIGSAFRQLQQQNYTKTVVITLIVALLFVIFFMARSVTRNSELRNMWTVMHADEQWRPLSFRGLFTIGAQYMNMKFPDKAMEYYQKALDTNHYDGNLYANILNYHLVKGSFGEAERFYQWAVKHGRYIGDKGRLNLAVALVSIGKCKEAQRIEHAINNRPSFASRIAFVQQCDDYAISPDALTNIKEASRVEKLLAEKGKNIERKPFLLLLLRSGNYSGKEVIEIVDQMAKICFISDIPEAIRYYKLEKSLYQKMGEQPPALLDQTIRALEDFSHRVLVNGEYFKLEF